MTRRVVVTGMGVITPVGNDVESMWNAVREGKTGIARIRSFDPSELDTQIAAEVKDFDAEEAFGRRDARRMDRFIQFAVFAAQQAAENSGIQIAEENANRVAVVVGSGVGGMRTLVEQMDVLRTKGPKRVSPLFIPMMLNDSAAGQVAINLGAQGPNLSVVSACATGSNAIGEAGEIIRRGAADVVFAGGTESAIVPLSIAAFNVMGALSTTNDEPKMASRPFDANRSGFVMGEGAGILVLEAEEHALARGANIVGELIGYGSSADAFHITAPREDGAGAAFCIQMALDNAGISPMDIDYINAHGTGTKLNDASETKAIKTAFGQRAYDVPISSSKAVTGHLLGGAGAIEAVVCLKAIQTNTLPPTINYETPDPDCDLDYVPNTARQANIRTVLTNSFGFGGHNATLILREWNGGR